MATTKYNKSEIMKEAHRIFKWNKCFNWSFSKCLSIAWRNAKVRIANEEVEARNKAAEEARRKEYRKNIVLKHVGMSSLYANGAYSGD